jgi:ATP-dependent helicase Lhr and Lhr-like helicase
LPADLPAKKKNNEVINSSDHPLADLWFAQKNFTPHAFQKETWQHIIEGKSGLLNAPTGFGKTYAILFGVFQQFANQTKKQKGLHALYITPLRALSKEIAKAANTATIDLGLDYDTQLRTGDTTTAQRAKQKTKPPQCLVTTPESVHLLLTSKGCTEYFSQLQFIIVDEWHELLGSKRGVQTELLIAKLKQINPQLQVWGISATIGNLPEAQNILLYGIKNTCTVTTNLKKEVHIETLIPENVEEFSWAGHVGLSQAHRVAEIIEQSSSTIVFTNTRGHSENWYQGLLNIAPQLAGSIALHHGSLSQEIRTWVEDNLHSGKLKAVVATSSLDLGVDFQPVDTVVQIGSPKGVARILQRAGRSGHQPHAVSKLYLMPTNTLEIIEGAALKRAVQANQLEQRLPYVQSFDVLVQFLVTLAVGDGFKAEEALTAIRNTLCFAQISDYEFSWCLQFITQGGACLQAYSEYNKVHLVGDTYYVASKQTAMLHRLSIGTIVSDGMMRVKYLSGKQLGVIEEWFISKLKPNDAFWFAGLNLELIRIKDMEVHVRKTNNKKGIVPSYMGGRMPLSSELSGGIRAEINKYVLGEIDNAELRALLPVFNVQDDISHTPAENELLIETLETKEGHHIFIYPFEGRFVHEGIAAIIAYRLGKILPISFSIAMNDYGFELLSDQALDIAELLAHDVFNATDLSTDVLHSINANEMAKRKFRDIACISGLVFNGYPGQEKKARHLQATSQLFFQVFADQEPDNLLYQQAFQEVLDFQLEMGRMQQAFKRISQQKIVHRELKRPSPFCFPLVVDQLRERYTSETLEARIQKLLKQQTAW